MGSIAAPEPLAKHHDIRQFRSGVPSLDAWLQRKARLNEAKGGARTYVACDGLRVAAFHSLAASAVERRRVPSRVGRSMPQPVPVILLGQLAVDTDYQGRGLGSDLLVDAAKRALIAADARCTGDHCPGSQRAGKVILRALQLPTVLGSRAAHAGRANLRTAGVASSMTKPDNPCPC